MTDEAVSRGYGDHPDIVPDPALHIDVEGRPLIVRHQPAAKVVTDHEIRCEGKVPDRANPGSHKTCGKLLIEYAARPWKVTCPRCKQANRSPGDGTP